MAEDTDTEEELREMARAELTELEAGIAGPGAGTHGGPCSRPIPEDERNAIIEIRAGTGGDEAALFAG